MSRDPARGEPAGGPVLDPETESLVGLSAALASGERARWTAALDDAAARADPVAVEEALLQSYLFLGYPAALNGLAEWRARSGRPPTAPEREDPAAWRERGEAVCARVYGGQYGRLRANVSALHPDLERWMVTEGYGKVLARPGLDLKRRELCVVALLAGLDAPRQLYSHLRGALNVGAAPAEIDSVLAVAARMLPPDKSRAASRLWAEVRARRAGEREN